jgi:hypothetical protein
MAIKYANIFQCNTLQNIPKLGFFGLKIYKVTTLLSSWCAVGLLLFFNILNILILINILFGLGSGSGFKLWARDFWS